MTEGYGQVKRAKLFPEKCYYVYIHRRKTDNIPFYVGKGSRYRAWVKTRRSDWWKRVADKHGFTVDLVFENLSESEAYQCEIDTILELTYFNYPLVNLTAGGLGGLRPSEETRKKQSQAKLGKFTGLLNPFSDKNSYVFFNKILGLTLQCTRSELCCKYKIPSGQLKKLFLKKPRRTVYGWQLKDINEYKEYYR